MFIFVFFYGKNVVFEKWNCLIINIYLSDELTYMKLFDKNNRKMFGK